MDIILDWIWIFAYLKNWMRFPATAVSQICIKPPLFIASEMITLNTAANISSD